MRYFYVFLYGDFGDSELKLFAIMKIKVITS
jgi:hypothetical protein